MRGQIRIPITPECTRGRIHAAWPDRGALVEEIACVIWRKRRLRLAEAGSIPAWYSTGGRDSYRYYSSTQGRLSADHRHRLSDSDDSKRSCCVRKTRCLTARTRNFEGGTTRGVQSRVRRTRRSNADILARTTRPQSAKEKGMVNTQLKHRSYSKMTRHHLRYTLITLPCPNV